MTIADVAEGHCPLGLFCALPFWGEVSRWPVTVGGWGLLAVLPGLIGHVVNVIAIVVLALPAITRRAGHLEALAWTSMVGLGLVLFLYIETWATGPLGILGLICILASACFALATAVSAQRVHT